jgi:hypothetical protein
MKIEKGDLIQLDSWFGDVWAEVLDNFVDMIVYVMHSKGGEERWTELVIKEKIRRVAHTEAEKASVLGSANVLHLELEYFGSFGRHKYWGYPANRKASGNHREIYNESRRENQ